MLVLPSDSVGTIEIIKYAALHLFFLDILTGHQFLSPVISCATVKIIALKYKPPTFSMATSSLLPACHNILEHMQGNFALRCELPFFVGGKMWTLKAILKDASI